MERLIFLYYLQKRGWLNQQHDYLISHLGEHRERPDDFSYYADFLEQLFWTLSSPSSAPQRLQGIPFLNGGLFDDSEFAPTPIRKKSNPPLRITNATFAKVFDDFLERFNFTVAVSLIPDDWSSERKALWTARFEAIRDNEHIARIEQPVYKRRWDEQWKVGNRWECGQPAYDAEFLSAFSWWLSEKAEWWLETQADGGPVSLDTWTDSLWTDSRIQAAWQVATDISHRLDIWKRERAEKPPPKSVPKPTKPNFAKFLKTLVKDQSVPDNIPYAVAWSELESQGQKIPAAVKKIRGKLNVPRERFQIAGDKNYKVARINS